MKQVSSAIVGTMKHVARRHVQRYLAEFQWRFNRRYDLPAMIADLGQAIARAAPRPRDKLKLAHRDG